MGASIAPTGADVTAGLQPAGGNGQRGAARTLAVVVGGGGGDAREVFFLVSQPSQKYDGPHLGK